MLKETFVSESAHFWLLSEIGAGLSHVVLAQTFSSAKFVLAVS